MQQFDYLDLPSPGFERDHLPFPFMAMSLCVVLRDNYNNVFLFNTYL